MSEEYQQETSLEYKRHDAFFESLFKIRNELLESLAKTRIDNNLIMEAFGKLEIFLNLVTSQTRTFITLEEKQQRKNKIFLLVKQGSISKAIDEIESFHHDISIFIERVGIIPKPEIQPIKDELTTKDEKLKAAFMAYDLLYGYIVND